MPDRKRRKVVARVTRAHDGPRITGCPIQFDFKARPHIARQSSRQTPRLIASDHRGRTNRDERFLLRAEHARQQAGRQGKLLPLDMASRRVEPLLRLPILDKSQARRGIVLCHRLVTRNRRRGIQPGEIDKQTDDPGGENRQWHPPR